jgi:peptide-methionine (S)-S-oxide reductase
VKQGTRADPTSLRRRSLRRMFGRDKTQMVAPDAALAGRPEAMPVPAQHHVNFHTLGPDFPDGIETAVFGMGCFWGSEELYWQLPGVYSTAVGYAGGFTPNPTYEETCSGRTGHTEVVLVAYDPAQVTYEQLLKVFWENHDPTLGMRQGNDIGSQYRSAIYTTTDDQAATAKASVDRYQEALDTRQHGQITTEVKSVDDAGFYYAEGYHQQYLAKNPHGYRCHAKSGIDYPIGSAGS